MKVLHIMKGCPFPPTGGFESDIWNRMVAMRNLGCSIHVLMTVRKSSPDEARLEQVRKVADRVDLVPRSLTASSFLTLEPGLVATNRPLMNFPLEDEYDLTLAESENMTPIFNNPRLRTKLRVVRVHNDETKYNWTLAKAEEKIHWKTFFALDAIRYARYTPRAFRKLDGIWFISKSERDRYTQKHPDRASSSYWMPPAIQLKEQTSGGNSNSRTVLCVGGLSVPLNREGLRWYLKEVHPTLLADPEYRLIVAGGTRGLIDATEFAQWLRGIERCEVHLDRLDLGPLYDQSAVIINPMQQGAGVKLKTIHAIQQRIPLVTTSIGAEGAGFLNGDHIRIADTPAAFAAAVKNALQHPQESQQMAERAYQYLCQNFDQEQHIRSFLESRLPGAPLAFQPPVLSPAGA